MGNGEELNAEESRALLARVASLVAQTTVYQGILHDIKNCVHAISSDVAFLMGERFFQSSPRVMQHLGRIEENVSNLDLLISRGRELGHWLSSDQGNLDEVDIAEVLKEAIRRVQHLGAKIMLRGHASSTICEIPRSIIIQVFANLLHNSLEAKASSVDIRIGAERSKGEEEVVVRLEDNGTGISEDILDRVFEPFFTTKASSSGLGLTVARQCLLRYGGHLSLKSSSVGGTTAVLRLPLKRSQPQVGKAKGPEIGPT